MKTPVESSLLSSIEYLSDQTLDLTFRSGVTYRYFAVPEIVVKAFIDAESKGGYFNHHVRDRFPYQRQGPDSPICQGQAVDKFPERGAFRDPNHSR